MKTETHDQGRQNESDIRRKESGHCDPETKNKDRQGGQAIFLDEYNHIYDQQCQKSRNLSDGLNHSDVVAVQSGDIHGEIVKQGLPGLQPCGGTDR